MRESVVEFGSSGATLAGILRLPDAGELPYPVVVQGPGWLGLADTQSYVPYHEAFTDAGLAVLVFDYRGFGDSDGDATVIDPAMQVDDWCAAIEFCGRHPGLDAERLGVFGSGGTGGGNAIEVAARDGRARAVVAQVPVADGEDWLRRQRTAEQWRAFRAQVAEDPGRMVLARGELTIGGGDRAGWKRDVDGRVPERVTLASAAALFRYRPLDVVGRIAPRATMIVAVENDDVTPTDHAKRLFEATGQPKRLVLQRGTTHYRAYADHRHVVLPMMVRWFERHVLGRADGVDPDAVITVGTAG
jgi:dipeptidyl aminopeptidase/acylaminoacyl peptidase